MVKNRESFTKILKEGFKKANVAIAAPLFNEIIDSLSEYDDTADTCVDSKGKMEPNSELRDYENVPLKEDVTEYMKREVLPHVPDAWVDESKTKIGYEINFNRYFYKYVPPRPLEEIEADLRKIEAEIAQLLNGMEQ
jgi:type I restriction enzyme M protein